MPIKMFIRLILNSLLSFVSTARVNLFIRN
jgi:hypothetical protein